MSFIGNVFWFFMGGAVMGLAWWLAGILMFLSIIGIPWGRACFVIGTLTFFPFGKDVVDRDLATGRDDIGTGCLGIIGNIIWFAAGGFWLAVGHVSSALFCFVTIIGIPFGIQHLKLAYLTLFPIGKTVVDRY